jgi:hypothetical protein
LSPPEETPHRRQKPSIWRIGRQEEMLPRRRERQLCADFVAKVG